MHSSKAPDQDSLQLDSSRGVLRMKEKLLPCVRWLSFVSDNFSNHHGQLRAAALTYTTVLSLVPLLAIAFSVLKGFGAQNALEPFLEQIAGDSGEMISRIIDYVNNTNVKSMGAIGLVMLIVTVISLMGRIEESFNAVWGVRETRSVQRRFSDYLSVIIVGPILLLAATSMTSSLQSQWMLQWLIQNTYLGDAIRLLFRFLPYVSVWTAMVFLYLFIPNTKIRFSSALVGGITAGTAWELAQWGYFHFQVGVANYNAIYGTMAAVPIFLVWIYTSWIIVLYGLEIVFAHQHRSHGASGNSAGALSTAAREELGVALIVQVAWYFQSGGSTPSSQNLADDLDISLLILEPICDELAKLGFLASASDSEQGWLPGRDPSTLLVSDIISTLRGNSGFKSTTPAIRLAEEVVQKGMKGWHGSLGEVTVRDLLGKIPHVEG